MIQGFNTKKYGLVTLKNVEDTIELVGDDFFFTEEGARDLNEMTIEEVETIIDNKKDS